MTGMKRRLAFVALAFLTAVAVQAVDYGVEILNEIGINNADETDWYTDHQAALWLTVPFDRANTRSLAVEGRLYGARQAETENFKGYLNLELFRFSYSGTPGTSTHISLDAGRIMVQDITGYILNQALDGAQVHGTFAFGNVDAFMGYTGLLNARKTGALMSADDYRDMESDAPYALGAKRLVGKVTAQFPQLIGPVDLIGELTGQYDLRDKFESDQSQLIHTGYATVSASGPLVERLYFTASGTWQTGVLKTDVEYSETAYLILGRIDWFFAGSGKAYAEFLYTSAQDDTFTSFLPITFQSAGELFQDGYGNLWKATIGALYNPLEFLNLDIAGKFFMYPKEVIKDEGVYRGTELLAGAMFLVRSDVRVRCEGSLFFPKDEDTQYQASLKAILDL